MKEGMKKESGEAIGEGKTGKVIKENQERR